MLSPLSPRREAVLLVGFPVRDLTGRPRAVNSTGWSRVVTWGLCCVVNSTASTCAGLGASAVSSSRRPAAPGAGVSGCVGQPCDEGSSRYQCGVTRPPFHSTGA